MVAITTERSAVPVAIVTERKTKLLAIITERREIKRVSWLVL